MLMRSRQSSSNIVISSDSKKRMSIAKFKNTTKLIKLLKKNNRSNIEAEQKSIKETININQPMIVVTSSEAEKHLNFNLTPSQDTQKKIDYFLTPYNKSKMTTRYMNFNERDPKIPSDVTSKEKWNKISKLILNQDKHSFRNTLRNINDKLYLEIEKSILQKQEQLLNNGKNKRLRFAEGNKNPSRKKSSYNKIIALANQMCSNKRGSLPHNQYNFDVRASAITARGRKSVISQAIEDIREARIEKKRRDDQNCGELFDSGKVLKRSKTVHMRRNDINMAPAKLAGMMADMMSQIPESVQKYTDLESNASSKSEFGSSETQSRKIECNSDLIYKLLNRDHHIFKRNKSHRNLIKHKIVNSDHYETTKDCTNGYNSPRRNKNSASIEKVEMNQAETSNREYFIKVSKDNVEKSFVDRCAEELDQREKLIASIKNPGKSRSNQIGVRKLMKSTEIQNQSEECSSKFLDTYFDKERYSAKSIPVLTSFQDSTTFSSRYISELLTRDYISSKHKNSNSSSKPKVSKPQKAFTKPKELKCIQKSKIISFV